jgi:ribosomal protein S18 acetylase RimI-like enzyme
MVEIRAFQRDDLNDLYRVCLETGAGGGAAYRDNRLVGHVYAAPYALLSPQSVFVAEDGLGVGGYIVGTPDTRYFEALLEAEWWPGLRRVYSDPSATSRTGWSKDQLMMHRIYHPAYTPSEIVDRYPAHLHINLLARLRGQGIGRRLMDQWLRTIREMGSPGAHLAVGAANLRAIQFYQACGFRELHSPSPALSDPIWYGISLIEPSMPRPARQRHPSSGLDTV